MKISEILKKYETDKVRGFDPNGHCYGETYDEIFSKFDRQLALNIMEVGVQKGGSLLAWKEYFPNATVTGIDIVDVRKPEYISESVNFIKSNVRDFIPTATFDIVIDDGSHLLTDVVFVVKRYLSHLNPGGVIIIEDVQRPGEWVPEIQKIIQPLGGFELQYRDLRKVHGYGDDFMIIVQRTSK